MKNPFLTVCLLLSMAAAVVPAWGIPTNGEPAEGTAAVSKGAPQKTQLHTRITNVVANFVRQQTASLPGKVVFNVNELDRRLVLSACARLEAFLPARSQLIGRTSVGVRCNESGGWSIFVPVQIRISLEVLISARQLPLGHTLREQDLASLKTETTHTAGLTDPKLVIGKVLRYGIAAGQVLRENMLRSPFSVTQGQIVQLIAMGSGFTINGEGAALNNASEGQTVQVRVGSSRVIGGIARANGVVEIGL